MKKMTFLHAAILVGLLLALVGCRQEQTEPEPAADVEVVELQEDELTAGVEQLVKDPTQYEGQTVSVTGEIETIFNPKAFTIGDGGPDMLFVFTIDPLLTEPATVGDRIKVTGILHQYILADVEAQLGREVEEEVKTEIAEVEEMRPIMIATSISVPE